jgi:hypothetical protein
MRSGAPLAHDVSSENNGKKRKKILPEAILRLCFPLTMALIELSCSSDGLSWHHHLIAQALQTPDQVLLHLAMIRMPHKKLLS